MAEKRTIKIEVLRYNPEKDAEPHFQTFEVPFTHDTSVLQGLQYIKDHLDGSLSFRWSCRMAICGSCAFHTRAKDASSLQSRWSGNGSSPDTGMTSTAYFSKNSSHSRASVARRTSALEKAAASNGNTLALLPRRQASAPGSPSRSAAASCAS